MSLRRFHVSPVAIDGGRLAFDAEEARHMARTLRLRPGDVVTAVDGTGREYLVRLEQVAPDAAAGTVLAEARSRAESPLAITLAQSVPKGDKLEAIVRAASELGVVRVAPLVTERTVVRLDGARLRDRTRRWQRVAKEAAKQCGRAVIPAVDPPRALAEFLAGESGGALALCLWEGEKHASLGSALAALAPPVARATVLVGPEGGLAPGEVALAAAHGFTVVGLGPRILRTETAGPAVVAMLQARLGDLGG